MARSDEEYAELAARHGYGDDRKPRQTLNRQTGKSREEEFSEIGVKSQADAKNLCMSIRQSEDTKCFRAPDGREVYANDRLKALHYSNENKPEKSTVFPNNDPTRAPTERLNDIAQAERDRAKQQGLEAPCTVRTGGSKALEQDRQETEKTVEKPRDQSQVLKDAQEQQRESPDQALSPGQRRAALQEASAAVEKDQEALKEAHDNEPNEKRKEQIALKATIEKADFDRHAAPERYDQAVEENGPQSVATLFCGLVC